MDLHNSTHWMEDEAVQSIDKRKLEFIASLFQSFQGKSKTEVSTGLMGHLKYAKENGFKIERYPADWKKYSKSAGPRRNKTMAEISDFVICFWDGQSKGTKSMIEYAKKYKKPIRIKRIAVSSRQPQF